MLLRKAKTEPKPQEGDYKLTIHFAWWPHRINGDLVWLEKYKKVYEWQVRDRRNYIIGSSTTFLFPNCGGWDLLIEKRYK